MVLMSLFPKIAEKYMSFARGFYEAGDAITNGEPG